jgi:hypothetical protein
VSTEPTSPRRPTPEEDRPTPAPPQRTPASYERRDVRNTIARIRGW